MKFSLLLIVLLAISKIYFANGATCSTANDCSPRNCQQVFCNNGQCEYNIPTNPTKPLKCLDGDPNTNYDFCAYPTTLNGTCYGYKTNLTYVLLTVNAPDGVPLLYPFILANFFANTLGIPLPQLYTCYDFRTATGGISCVAPTYTGEFTYQLNISSAINSTYANYYPILAGNGSADVATLIAEWVTNNAESAKSNLNVTAAVVPCQPFDSDVCLPNDRGRNLGIMIGIATFLFILTIVSCVIFYARKAHTWSKSYGATGGTTESTASMNEEMSNDSRRTDN